MKLRCVLSLGLTEVDEKLMGKLIDRIFGSHESYQFEEAKAFGLTQREDNKLREEIKILIDSNPASDFLDESVELSDRERDLASRRFESNIQGVRIYFSMIAISISLILYGLVNIDRITTNLMNPDYPNGIIVYLFSLLFLYFLLRSLALMALVLANSESRIRVIHHRNTFIALDLYDSIRKNYTQDYRKIILQYVTIRLIDYSTDSIEKGNNHLRQLISESTIQLIRAISLIVTFLPYFFINLGDVILWSFYFPLSLFLFSFILVRDGRNTLKLVKAIFIPTSDADVTER